MKNALERGKALGKKYIQDHPIEKITTKGYLCAGYRIAGKQCTRTTRDLFLLGWWYVGYPSFQIDEEGEVPCYLRAFPNPGKQSCFELELFPLSLSCSLDVLEITWSIGYACGGFTGLGVFLIRVITPGRVSFQKINGAEIEEFSGPFLPAEVER